VDAETLRRWMLAAGLWHPARKTARHRQRRERSPHFGELVQLDGSVDAWLEDWGPRGCLMNMVDDATNRISLRVEPQETIWGAVRSLRRWIAAYGIPQALYTDWKYVHARKPTEAEVAAGTVPLTQFGRMCATLAIRIIAASSRRPRGVSSAATGRIKTYSPRNSAARAWPTLTRSTPAWRPRISPIAIAASPGPLRPARISIPPCRPG
jgi:hypothetical protein